MAETTLSSHQKNKGSALQRAITCLIVDDFEPMRRYLCKTIQQRPELRIVAEVADGAHAVQKAHELKPDLILMDVGLPTLDGIEATRRIQRVSPRSKILFVTENRSTDVAEEALRSGGVGYVLKSSAPKDLLSAIDTVLRSERFFDGPTSGNSYKANEEEDAVMSKHVSISLSEGADRLAIRELVEAYAHCADRRDAKGQMALFTPDTHFMVYMNAKDPKPSQELHSREALAPVFADLNKYHATMHFVGQSTILSLTADRGTGETYCLAHHLTVADERRRLMIAALRYSDTFVKVDDEWLFAERLLYVDWIEERILA